MSESKNNSGCWLAFIAIILIGGIAQKCEESDKAKAAQNLKRMKEQTMDSLEHIIQDLQKVYLGVYEGTLRSETYIPAADIYPEDQMVTFRIVSFVPVVIEEGSQYYSSLSENYNMNKNHIEGRYISEFKTSRGEREAFEGTLYYFPLDKKFCIGSSIEEANAHSLFGGDMCDVILTPLSIDVYGGNAKGKLYRKNMQ